MDDQNKAPELAARPRLCLVTTSPIVVSFFLLPHLRELVRLFDVTLVANADCTDVLGDLSPAVHMKVVPVRRKISPLNDCRALLQLVLLFRRERYDAVVTIAPKAGLLGNLSAFLARVPYRCHIFQGEVWVTRRGIMRWLLKSADRLTALTATDALVVSASERAFLIEGGILSSARSTVLGSGSLCGVDTKRFAPNPVARRRIRDEFAIPADATLVLFLGRLDRDKGVLDLVAAWSKLVEFNQDLHLAIVGPDEAGLLPSIRALVGPTSSARLHIDGFTDIPEDWMAAADILCLPSYREGFGSVVIEAGAAELPVIVSRIYGTANAFVENVTGLAHPPGDRLALAKRLDRLVKDRALRASLGQAARARVIEKFEQTRVVQRYADYFRERSIPGAGTARNVHSPLLRKWR